MTRRDLRTAVSRTDLARSALTLDDPMGVRSLWTGGAAGALYDAAIMSSLGRSNHGHDAASLNNPVGLITDQRLATRLGSDVLVNGAFTDATGWTVTGTDATHIATFSGGTLRYQADTSYPLLSVAQSGVLTVGTLYEASALVTSRLKLGGFRVAEGFDQPNFAVGLGINKTRFLAESTGFSISRNGPDVDSVFDWVSVRQILGNHAYQSDNTKRPTWLADGARRSFLFNGTTQYTTCTAPVPTANLLLGVSIRTGAIGARRVIWSNKTTNSGISLEVATNGAITVVAGNGTSDVTLTGSVLAANSDYRVLLTYSGTLLSLIVNGVTTTAALSSLAAGSSTTTIGAASDASAFWNGRIYVIGWRSATAIATPDIDKLSAHLAARTAVAAPAAPALLSANIVKATDQDTYDPTYFGAKTDGSADCSLALNTIISAIIASDLPAKPISIAGVLRIDQPVNIDRTAITTNPEISLSPQIRFIGRGPTASQIYSTHGGAAITYLGNSSTALHTFFAMRCLSLRGPARARGSIGLRLEKMAYAHFEEVDVTGYEFGVDALDLLSTTFIRTTIRKNIYGIRCRQLNVSAPNALTFISPVIGNNYQWGGLFEGGSNTTLIGGSIEGNGLTPGLSGSEESWGLKFVDTGAQGTNGLVVSGTYLEVNAGVANLWITQSARKQSCLVSGATFSRGLNNHYSTNQLRHDVSGAGEGSLVAVIGTGFRSTGAYVPDDVLRPHIGGTPYTLVNSGGNTWDGVIADQVWSPQVMPVVPVAVLPSAVGRAGQILGVSNGDSGSQCLAVSDGATWRRVPLGATVAT